MATIQQRILVSSAPQVGKRTLLAALLGAGDIADASSTAARSEPGIRAVHPWRLDTRYYTADVDVCVLDNGHRALPAGTQGLLLMHDVSKVRCGSRGSPRSFFL
jgi:hypothetical protein